LKFEASEFVYDAPPIVSRARRVLIKPNASSAEPYPVTTSREILAVIIDGIRKVSDADIIILEGSYSGESMTPIYQTLGYDFPRVLTLDVKDCVWVEVDNPLPKPLAIPAFWIPNVILSSDYLISVSPLQVVNGQGSLSIHNLLSLLPFKKYGEAEGSSQDLNAMGMDNVIADLYFTLPFDVGIVEARKKLIWESGADDSSAEYIGKIFVGDPFQVDREVSETLDIKTDYLDRIKLAESGIDTT
jgi:uncharacterized protein (DUF362 family)